ncbi:MAG TPA: sce7726 family protein [Verrucomicrobiae bacterium]|nr:sce7726 family protein [Verrucomicrobiae bacterium]
MTRDIDVRRKLRASVAAEFSHDPGSMIIDELGILEGECRIDLAVVGGQLHGYEIKSDADTLDRLPAQLAAYNAVFDRITLVAGSRHAGRAFAMVPEWWGLTAAVTQGRRVVLRPERAAQLNRQVDPVAVASLLWRDEVVAVLKTRCGGHGLASHPRALLWKLLARLMPVEELQGVVRTALRERKDWRPEAMRV